LNSLLKNTGTFFNWLRRQRMVSENPLEFVRLVDTRRVEKFRRAFLPVEMQRLLDAAPHERSVVYLTAVNAGLRRNEMQQLTLADLALDSPEPFLRVRASTAKHPKVSRIRLKPEVVDAIRSILPDLAPPNYRVFAGLIPRVPTFRKDLARANVSFLDTHGRRLDFHSLRDTYGTNLASAGVAPFTLKEPMRHSTVQQSEKYYIDAIHLPLADAVAKLPKFSLSNEQVCARRSVS
jgi:integrase